MSDDPLLAHLSSREPLRALGRADEQVLILLRQLRRAREGRAARIYVGERRVRWDGGEGRWASGGFATPRLRPADALDRLLAHDALLRAHLELVERRGSERVYRFVTPT